ncbi:U32 family peptidase, partial [Serratia marcescens]|uniref:U32 family peptidase n=1 Tax=Serratia marcescens TaxID=615 RepID=UPI0019544172
DRASSIALAMGSVTIRRIVPDRTIHLSTQANTTTWRSALFWQQQGISRINLAREMSLEALE